VRLRVRVRGDRLTVLDSHLVDGPLTEATTLHGAGVYEVTDVRAVPAARTSVQVRLWFEAIWR
jgi:hypothetical protein